MGLGTETKTSSLSWKWGWQALMKNTLTMLATAPGSSRNPHPTQAPGQPA